MPRLASSSIVTALTSTTSRGSVRGRCVDPFPERVPVPPVVAHLLPPARAAEPNVARRRGRVKSARFAYPLYAGAAARWAPLRQEVLTVVVSLGRSSVRIPAKAISPSGVCDHPRSEAAERPTRGSGSPPDHHLLSMCCEQPGMARLARTGGRMQVSGVGMTHQRASWGV